ncbi:MAG: HipA domain-containing protein [Coriobacteriia bacterium]|nr:HipA domain-containing protein [Coriobacteriia bacterium]
MTRLSVHLYGQRLGWLVLRNKSKVDKSFDFEADLSAIEHFGLDSVSMSVAVPLRIKQNPKHVRRRQNFFSELLPEGRTLAHIANTARLDGADTFAILAHYGRDLAGALEFIPEADGVDEPVLGCSASSRPGMTEVDAVRVRYLLEHSAQYPLGNQPITGKTSLAGVQNKILLAKTEGGTWAQVHGGMPSTHIIKPPVQEYPTIIFDEAWGLELARATKLIHYDSWIEDFAGLPALVITRFDRTLGVPGTRIHQEDFNQALGAAGAQKYQEHGGRVSLKLIAGVVATYSDEGSLRDLARQVIYTLAIGNLDMHAKNISIFHLPNERVQLTPAYDLVPLQHQSTDGRLAMSIAGEYVHALIDLDLLVTEFLSWGAAGRVLFGDKQLARDFIRAELATIQQKAKELPVPAGAYSGMAENVVRNTSNLLADKRIGQIESYHTN